MRSLRLILLCLPLVLFGGCGGSDAPQVPANKLPKSTVESDFLSMNARFMEYEREDIRHYIDSLGWEMDTTLSGLHYRIDEVGYGDTVSRLDEVTVRYSIALLDGEVCDEMREVVRTARLGKGQLVKGLEEAIRMLKASGSGTFVIPSYLAYGVSGKNGCVPPWSPILCKVCLIETRK